MALRTPPPSATSSSTVRSRGSRENSALSALKSLERGVGHGYLVDRNDRELGQEIADDALAHHAGAAEDRDFHLFSIIA